MKTQSKSAVLFGATGLIGRFVLVELLKDKRYHKVVILSRRPLDITHEKLEQQIVDFDNLLSFKSQVEADHLYCCLGTTISKAGSKAEFIKIDHDIPLRIAKFANENGVRYFALVSSVGANVSSANFYSNTKGMLEENIREQFQQKIGIFRPSLLLGEREEARTAERIGQRVLPLLNPLLLGRLKKFKAIKAETVAKAMVNIAFTDTELTVFESDQIEIIA
ncbi:MAG: NAD-dependent epimerase/dehydratase family protein [Flavobacteriales bacterium]|nr:NAD-dependent epimerase/dehydratase family protein [Flavobacteriales bacterium]